MDVESQTPECGASSGRLPGGSMLMRHLGCTYPVDLVLFQGPT